MHRHRFVFSIRIVYFFRKKFRLPFLGVTLMKNLIARLARENMLERILYVKERFGVLPFRISYRINRIKIHLNELNIILFSKCHSKFFTIEYSISKYKGEKKS